MQSQIRAENGIKEIVVGYVGEVTEDQVEELEADEVSSLIQGMDNNVIQTNAEDLPPEIRDIYLAEMHRLKTGEYKAASEFKALEGKANG